MKLYGQLENAQFENKTSDYSAGVVGRAWFRTDTFKLNVDDGTNIRALLRNDGYAIIGNNGTAANNIRLHRGAAGVLQFVSGADVTAEGSLSTAINQISFRAENYATGSLPAFGNAGRLAWDTTTVTPKVDTGAAWKEIVTLDATQILTNKDFDGGTASDAKRITLPKDTKANLDSLTRKQGTIWFATDQNKAYVDNGSSLVAVGSGGGGGGVNFLILDSSFAATQSDSADIENSVGNWAMYADAAGSIPVDMTGGAPSSTAARTTTTAEILNGAASLEITKSAANRQGEGVSCVGYVPIGYRGQVISIQFAFMIVSGSLVSGDLAAFVYDVTNSQVLTPSNNGVTANGLYKMTFAIPSTCAQIRFGLHFASTSATAVNFVIDDISVGPQEVVYGPSMTDESTQYSITPSAAHGTVTNTKYVSRRVGNKLHMRATLTLGTTTAATASLALPTGLTLDSSNFLSTSNIQQVGYGHTIVNAASGVFTNGPGIVVFYDGSDTSNLYYAYQQGTYTYNKITSLSSAFASGDILDIYFEIPISGWATNVVQQNAGMFSIASYLQNGTRVTAAAPTALGQYRSYLRNVSANTYTETNGSPGTAPTAADGILIYRNTAWGTVNTNNQPTRYEIFVGKYKQVIWRFYLSAARTGFIDCTPGSFTSTIMIGYATNYDPVTGIASIIAPTDSARTAAANTGFGSTGAAVTSNVYFDIFVSDQVVPVQVQPLRSSVHLDTPNGFGSSSTFIRRYTNTKTNIGSAITYADSGTLGATFTINEDGIYSIHLSDSNACGITKNESGGTLASNINAVAVAEVLAAVNVGSGCSCGWTGLLRAGDIIRAHTNGTASAAPYGEQFVITKVSN